MSNLPTIEFINHACVIVDAGSVRILCDPWLTGSVFHNGWDLLVPPIQPVEELNFTHLWISHEHPDHFSPTDLKRLLKSGRQSAPIYFQRTADGNVLNYCKSLGFRVFEMTEGQRYPLDDAVSIQNGVVGGFDSWLNVRTDTASILNLNDCRVHDPDALRRLKRGIGELDVLLTQFGYANWVGVFV